MRISTWIRFLIELAISIVAPPRCGACGEAVSLRHAFCASCARTVVARPVAACPAGGDGRSFAAPFIYGGAVARAIVRFKYDPRPDLAAPLGELMRRGVAHLAGYAPDVVVPVPLHPSRLTERGFNQAALLAKPIARELRARLLARALVRTRDTPKQASLGRSQRLHNVRSAFVARDAIDVKGKRILLVDDVRTTGATLLACEEALRRAGALEVRSLVLAAAET